MKRLIAVGVKESWESEWQRAQGNEREVVAHPIGEGERVWLEAVDGAGAMHRLLLSAIPSPLRDIEMVRYRVVKDASRAVETLPTTVELILYNGQTSTRPVRAEHT